MPVLLDVDQGVPISTRSVNRLVELFACASTHAKWVAVGDWSVVLRLTDDDEISALHARYFADPSPTDVITFPSGEPLDADGGYLGDIAVSVNTARRQAADAGHVTEREIAFLALHGLLHLLGHDDRTDEARAAMLARQERLLEQYEAVAGDTW